MKPIRFQMVLALVVAITIPGRWVMSQPATQSGSDTRAQPSLLTVEGRVEVSPAGSTIWSAGQTSQKLNFGDRVRTGLRSRAVVQFSPLSVLRVNELTTYAVRPPSGPGKTAGLDLKSGSVYFFSRERPASVEFSTPLSSGAIRGTEFHLSVVASDGSSVVALIEGALSISNTRGSAELVSGEQAAVEPGRAPKKSAVINAVNLIQWCLYYPGVLNADELHFTDEDKVALADSLAAYRSGDLLGALDSYPEGRTPATDSEKIYLAALLLAVGQVDHAAAQLAGLSAPSPLAQSLGEVMAAVKFEPWQSADPAKSATAWLAESYYWQSRSQLDAALKAARQAVVLAPRFGFGWARVAELEFSFGRVAAAHAALDQALKLSPHNAEAVALQGFLLAAQNQAAAARQQFDQAIALDGGLGNAWLGRGLMRIHAGDDAGGREDLQVAATLEPLRSVLRSYLGKAFSNADDNRHAQKEFARARALDANDPTVWLYEALLDDQESRVNDAVNNLEKSQELNNNRSVYRSQMLLDQDRAVRGANLARIYQDAGMGDVSLREAVKAVNSDYANYSSHLFLANTFFNLRDANGINLRYETPYVSEDLLANLLAPVGAGTLSQQISQQEYAKLFERDGVGMSSDSQYASHGDWRQDASEYGTYGSTSFALEQFYQSDHGYRANSDMEELTYDFRLKQQLTSRDSAYAQVTLANSSGGNQIPYFSQDAATNSPFRFQDKQNPLMLAGYHHEWVPGVDTLLLLSRLNDTYSVTNPGLPSYLITRDQPGGTVDGLLPFPASENYRSTFNTYSAELQQIWQADQWTTIAGARLQSGTFKTTDFIDPGITVSGVVPPTAQDTSAHFERENIYAYEQWQALDSLRFIGGVAYDRLLIPQNFRYAPISAGTEIHYHALPKAGLIWVPWQDTTVRAACAEAVAGASFDQDFQLEPTQVAGFNQAFRSLLPEAVAGANAGATLTTYGISLEQKLPTRTYLAVEAGLLKSTVQRQAGTFEFDYNTFELGPATMLEQQRFSEENLTFSTHQLAGRDWSLGASYRVSRARLDDHFPEIPDAVAEVNNFANRSRTSATLQTVGMQAIYQNPAGFFAQLEGLWTHQDNDDPNAPAGEAFWQCNLLVGQRFFHRHTEITLGILNLTDVNYRLNPLNLYQETPRERTFYAEFKFQF